MIHHKWYHDYLVEGIMHPIALITRTLADHDHCYIIGSATNLWLDGEPSEQDIVNYFSGSYGRELDIWVSIGNQLEITRLVQAITVGATWTTSKGPSGSHSPYITNFTVCGTGFQLNMYSAGSSVNDVLITMKADITANVKYVHKNELIGLIPAAIPDARERRLVWLSTCTRGRRSDIEWKMEVDQHSLIRGFYGTCAKPPPPPPEKYEGVLSGWRCYNLRWGYGDPGILQGDAGRYWQQIRFQAECNGSLTGKDSPDDPQHMVKHVEVTGGGACGIYLQFKPRVHRGHQIYASCVAWGNVLLHEYGCRAQYVKITKLYVVDPTLGANPEVIEFLSRVYQVPVVGRVPVVPMDEIWDGGVPQLPTIAEFLGVEELWDDQALIQ